MWYHLWYHRWYHQWYPLWYHWWYHMCVSFLLFVESIVVMNELVISQVFELLQFICGVVVLSSTTIALVVDSFVWWGCFLLRSHSNLHQNIFIVFVSVRIVHLFSISYVKQITTPSVPNLVSHFDFFSLSFSTLTVNIFVCVI